MDLEQSSSRSTRRVVKELCDIDEAKTGFLLFILVLTDTDRRLVKV